MSSSRQTDESERTWKVRDEDGTIFGPATMASLISWARDGRLASSHVISEDGENWTSVTACRELAMDWIVELSPGRFYGPIHRDALDELIRNDTIDSTAPQFIRTLSPDDNPNHLKRENLALQEMLNVVKADFAAHTGKLECDLEKSEAKLADISAQLETRDFDFEAERQTCAAAESKLKSELAKAEKKIETLIAQSKNAVARERNHAEDKAMIAQLRTQLDSVRTSFDEQKKVAENNAIADRKELRETQTLLFEAQQALKREQAKNAVLAKTAESASAMQLREESIRKLLGQVIQILGESQSQVKTEFIEDGEIVHLEEQPSLPPRPQSELMINAIEAQAWQEIQKLEKSRSQANS